MIKVEILTNSFLKMSFYCIHSKTQARVMLVHVSWKLLVAVIEAAHSLPGETKISFALAAWVHPVEHQLLPTPASSPTSQNPF